MFIGTGFAALIAFSRASEACSAASASLRSVMSTAKVPTASTLPSASRTESGSPWSSADRRGC